MGGKIVFRVGVYVYRGAYIVHITQFTTEQQFANFVVRRMRNPLSKFLSHHVLIPIVVVSESLSTIL